jgi:hypothetical protein
MDFPFSVISFNLTADALAELVFYLVTLFVGVVSAILFFHWRKYGLSKPVIAFTEVVYLVVCVLLISMAFVTLP